MALESVEACAAAPLPQTDRLVKTTAGKGLPIGAKGHRPDLAGMASQDFKALPAAHLPQAEGHITAATGKGAPIRAEGDGCYPTEVCLNGLQWSTTSSMPEPDLTCRRSRRQQVSLWAKRHTSNTA